MHNSDNSARGLIATHSLGFPRIGAQRELKRTVEAYWAGKIDRTALHETARELRRRHWLLQRDAGLTLVPSNDFSFYDHVLDTTCMVGAIPPRFGWKGGEVDLDTMFALARGVRPHSATDALGRTCSCAQPLPTGAVAACEMTKWFDTNYHYIVPELRPDMRFSLGSTKPMSEFAEALALGVKTKPVLLGPVTWLRLAKPAANTPEGFDRLSLLERLLPVYLQVLQRLAALGAEWVEIDEPCGALELEPEWRAALEATYATFAAAEPQLKLLVAVYYGALGGNLLTFLRLPVHALHIDNTRCPRELDTVIREFPRGKILSLGVVDARNVWRTEYDAVLPRIGKAINILGPERVWLAPSSSLLHSPVSLAEETTLSPEIRPWLAFATEKLAELGELRALASRPAESSALLEANRAVFAARRAHPALRRKDVRARCEGLLATAFRRSKPFSERQELQRERLKLPLCPTTTIGSFPQTDAVRTARARWRKGELANLDYERFIEREISASIRMQEELGLDVLVHGEFERTDMVEYFGEQLDGFVFTRNGWVQSYGSRCVKPPLIYGDVARPHAMTVRWSHYAQSLTSRPMKAMLTGPITILQWSFVRDDQPREDTARQIALALRDEVVDLENAGLPIIQIDEPALREGLPLWREHWKYYLDWATAAFRLTASGVRADTQIHTHMCYAEFNDIVEAIAARDADVITFEASRSRMEILEAFETFAYPNEIGPGVWDIHSPRVPSVEEMVGLLERAARVLPVENLWVNPDCGLKTRGWPETLASLANLVAAAGLLRAKLGRPITTVP